MAPEQLRGERAEARSDVFAFSVALYEALYDERPYDGATMRERLDAIVSGHVRPPPRGTKVPRAVRGVIVRGLRARPDDRWPTMGAMLDALERSLARRRTRIALGVAAGAIALAAIAVLARPARSSACVGVEGAIADAWSAPLGDAIGRAFLASGNPRAQSTLDRVRRSLDAYAARWRAMTRESCEATRQRGVQSDEAFALRAACLGQRRDELAATVGLLAKANADRVDDAVTMVNDLDDVSACSDVASLRAPYAVPGDPAQRGAIEAIRKQVAAATALVNARALDEAIAVLEPAARAAKAASDREQEAATLVLMGRAQLGRGAAKDAARTLFDAAIEAKVAHDATTEATAWIWLVRVVGYDMGELERSERYARIAGAALERAGDPPALHADLARHRAHALYAHGDLAASLPLYEEARALRERAFGAGSPLVGEIEVDLADIRAEDGHPRESIALYQSALAKRAASYGEGSPGLGVILANLSLAYEVTGASADAIAKARDALAVIRPGERLRAASRIDLALGLIEGGDVSAGLAEADAAMAEVAPDVSALKRGSFHDELADVLMRRHAVEPALREAAASEKLLSGPDSNQRLLREVRSIHALGEARSGHAKEALAVAAALVTEEEKAGGASSYTLLYPLLALGEASLAVGDAPAALQALERATAIADHAEVSPELGPDSKLALARALLAAHQDPARAQSLAERAATDYDALRLPDLAAQARTLATRVLAKQ
jgi:tetratricopeptide (TPR) repeat protein